MLRLLHLSLCVVMLGFGTDRAAAATIVVNSGGSLQSALNAAQPGDTVLLQAGATFVGNFTLPAKSGTSYITVRSSAADTALPGVGVRLTPQFATLLPKIKSPNTGAALKTATGAHHWRLQFLEIQANSGGYGDLVQLGRSDELSAGNQAHHLVLDRVYIHGDRWLGSKRGIALNSAHTTIVNSHFADFKGVGFDTQAICGWNGPGPFLIENNYIEAAGENLMFGGSDPAIQSLVPSDITIRRNHFSKPVAWRQPALGTPAPTAVPGPGILPGGTYAYRVVAYGNCGSGKTCRSTASSETTAVVPSGTIGGVTIRWKASPGASSYRVYGRTAASQAQYWTVAATTFTDDGTAGTTGSIPAGTGTKWTVKNLLELKNARRVLIEGNIFEYSWEQNQKGYAVLWTPSNAGGTAPWTVVADVTFQFNTVRHVAGGLMISGRGTSNPTMVSSNLLVRHNLFTDVSASRWGGSGGFAVVSNGASDVTIDHNTVDHTGFVVAASGAAMAGFLFTNNLSRHNTWGIYGSYHGAGLDSIDVYFPDADVRRNVLAGGPASKYPPDNFFPPASAFLSQFANAAAGDYHLQPLSPYKNAGTDAGDVGADIDRLLAAQARR